MNVRNVAVIGTGGLGREIIDCLDLLGDRFRLAGVLDDDADASSGFDYLGPIASENIPCGVAVIIGVGDAAARYHIVDRLGAGVSYQSIVHPYSSLSPNATIGAGVFVSPFTYVGTGASISDHVVLNVHSAVGHDATVDRFSMLSPYATLNGDAHVGEGCFLGTAAVVGVGVRIGAWSRIAAGTVADKACEVGSLVGGNPSKSRVMFRSPTER